MTFYVNAWLDRREPYVQIKNKQTEAIVAHFSSQELSLAIERGDICLKDFCDASQEAQMELIKVLLLIRCCEDMCNAIQVACERASVRADEMWEAPVEASETTEKLLFFPAVNDAKYPDTQVLV